MMDDAFATCDEILPVDFCQHVNYLLTVVLVDSDDEYVNERKRKYCVFVGVRHWHLSHGTHRGLHIYQWPPNTYLPFENFDRNCERIIKMLTVTNRSKADDGR